MGILEPFSVGYAQPHVDHTLAKGSRVVLIRNVIWCELIETAVTVIYKFPIKPHTVSRHMIPHLYVPSRWLPL